MRGTVLLTEGDGGEGDTGQGYASRADFLGRYDGWARLYGGAVVFLCGGESDEESSEYGEG
jgi:hypothetical protein